MVIFESFENQGSGKMGFWANFSQNSKLALWFAGFFLKFSLTNVELAELVRAT
ncbi:MAG: hypothetical protein MUD08_09170 [Cytophagales bacterium]|nr:hypothetical protein [Cytophagales bacterium]